MAGTLGELGAIGDDNWRRWRHLLPHFEMSLALQCGKIDAGNTGYADIIKRQISDDSDFGRAILILNSA